MLLQFMLLSAASFMGIILRVYKRKQCLVIYYGMQCPMAASDGFSSCACCPMEANTITDMDVATAAAYYCIIWVGTSPYRNGMLTH